MIRYLIITLALAGVIVSALALQVHYSTGTQPCSISEKWDCGVVNHSSFAVIGSVPVAALGIAGYLLLASLALARRRLPLLLVAFGGFCFAMRLTIIEEYVLGVWCLYCVYSQAIISLLLLFAMGWHIADIHNLKKETQHDDSKA